VSTSRLTPSQTVGPFFHDALLRPDAVVAGVVPMDMAGARVRIHGTMLDGAGEGVPDALIEAWQGSWFTRTATGEGGHFAFTTIHPSDVPGERAATDAPHIDVVIFARGLLNQLVTRIYLPDEGAHAADPVLQRVPAARRATLIARREPSVPDDGVTTYRFDIVLQGRDETVFLDVR
jgi:protocatechuate 3,4-dioxygenase alpha subunit